MIAVNLTGPFLMARAVLPDMLSRSRGVIVNTASVGGLVGLQGLSPYCASKGGVVGMTLTVARDLGAAGIRVNTIAPGLIDTAMLDENVPVEELMKMIPAQRMGTPEEFANAVAFLASPAGGRGGQPDGCPRLGGPGPGAGHWQGAGYPVRASGHWQSGLRQGWPRWR